MVDAGTGMVEGGEERREIGCDEVRKVLVISRNRLGAGPVGEQITSDEIYKAIVIRSLQMSVVDG